jgi:hypothetical protein
VEQEEAAIARHRNSKHVSAATNQHGTVDELLDAVFLMRLAPSLRKWDQREK